MVIFGCVKCANKITVPLILGPSDLSMKCEYCSAVQYFVDSGGINLVRWLVISLLILALIVLAENFTFPDIVFFIVLFPSMFFIVLINYCAYSYAYKHKELRAKRGENRP